MKLLSSSTCYVMKLKIADSLAWLTVLSGDLNGICRTVLQPRSMLLQVVAPPWATYLVETDVDPGM
jgi:hypothetical protein